MNDKKESYVDSNWKNVGENIKKMDRLYDASFYSWVRNDSNAELAATHIKRLMFDYDSRKIANGLRWLISEWTLGTISKFILKVLVDDLWTRGKGGVILKGTEYVLTKEQIAKRAEILHLVTFGWQQHYIAELLNVVLNRFTTIEQKIMFTCFFFSSWTFQQTSDLLISMGDTLPYEVKINCLKIFSVKPKTESRSSSKKVKFENEIRKVQLRASRPLSTNGNAAILTNTQQKRTSWIDSN